MALIDIRAAFVAIVMAILLGVSGAAAQDRDDPEEFYWQSDYADLSETEKQAMALLGWTEELWDSDNVAILPESELTEWSGLDPEQQEALASLGYSEEYWNETRPRRPDGDPGAFWAEQTDWVALRPAERAFWEQLGWDEASWNGQADPPASHGQSWTALSDEERAAAERLGFDQQSWDASR